MKFVYYFKTPDNARHDGEIESKDRESAFAELRERGIRAIKVEPKGWETGKGRVVGLGWWVGGVVTMLAVGVLLGFAIARNGASASTDGNGDVARSPAEVRLAALSKQADAIREGHRAALGRLRLDWARNYALIEHMEDVSPIASQIDKGQAAVRYAHMRVADLFRDILTVFSASEEQERTAAQRLYGELMDELDLDEYNLACAGMALSMLAENRGHWHEEKGKVVWDNEALRREFEPYSTDSSASTARWRRDFSGAKD